MIIRQSMLKKWQECPLKVRYEHLDRIERQQSASLTFGSIIHHCTQWLEENHDLAAAIALFEYLWCNPTALNDAQNDYTIQYYVRGTTWVKYMAEGPRILSEWWHVHSWDTDLVLAREYEFRVPIGNGHTLLGTVDKLKIAYRADIDQWVVEIVDYKSNRKVPTYEYLAEDLQFTAYGYATLQPEFWKGLPGGRGMTLMAEYANFPRFGRWVALAAPNGPKQLDAGIREERHYNRLTMAANAFAASYEMRIFVPTISGESCYWCEFRKQCGLPDIVMDDDWWGAA